MKIYHTDNMKNAYNRIAQKYHKNRETFDLYDLYLQLKAHISSSGTLLDLGCGAGDSISLYFAQENWEIDGFDFSDEMLKLAKINNPVMNLSCCDLCDIELENDKYYCAISIYALFHLPVNEQFKLMEKVYNSLKTGGIFFFTYGLDNCPINAEEEKLTLFMEENLFYAQAKQSSLMEKLKEVGFNVISIEEKIIGGENFHWYTVKK